MSKCLVTATWDDVPHLSAEVKSELMKEIPPYQRDARMRGAPQLGAGAIFPLAETDLAVTDFEIPVYWPRIYALDVGWNKTAAIWAARDNQAGIIYLYSEHYRGHAEPIIHVDAIKSRGDWIPGVIDPAAEGRSQIDGRRLLEIYRGYGLEVDPADNAVEAGLQAVLQLLSCGRLKIFKSLSNWFTEFRTFHRNEHGKIVDEHKYHLMACTRYLIMSGRDKMRAKPLPEKPQQKYVTAGVYSGSWMG